MARGQAAEQPQSVSAGPPAKGARRVEFYPVPMDIQDLDDGRKVAEVGLYKLTMDEETVALELAGEHEERRGIECVKAALCEFILANGTVQPLSIADGSADLALKAMSPQLRKICGTAYVLMHMPTEVQTGGFLAGRRVVLR